jgi:hypothetical protein
MASVFVSFAAALALTGLLAPASFAQEVGDLRVTIRADHQPADAGRDDLITHVPFDATPGASGFVEVLVEKVTAIDIEAGPIYAPVAPGEAEVKFRLATADDVAGGEPVATGTLTVAIEATGDGGIATFDSSLSIAQTNNLSTDYRIVPQARYASEITLLEEGWPFEGSASTGFDVWDDGCNGTGCNVNLRNNNETYTAQGEFGLGASRITGELVSCPDQKVIFGNTTFFHQTSRTESDVVFLLEHITREDMKASANNGQKHVGWCVGLETPGVWNFPLQDRNGNHTQDPGEFYVGMAPKCPNKRNAPNFAPCILSQMGDNLGGSFIRGYLPGGDPPRRT